MGLITRHDKIYRYARMSTYHSIQMTVGIGSITSSSAKFHSVQQIEGTHVLRF
jgi:hypothetical protein